MDGPNLVGYQRAGQGSGKYLVGISSVGPNNRLLEGVALAKWQHSTKATRNTPIFEPQTAYMADSHLQDEGHAQAHPPSPISPASPHSKLLYNYSNSQFQEGNIISLA